MAGQLVVEDSAGEYLVPLDVQVEHSVAEAEGRWFGLSAGGFVQRGPGKYQLDLDCAEADPADLEQVEAWDGAAVAPWESIEADKPAG